MGTEPRPGPCHCSPARSPRPESASSSRPGLPAPGCIRRLHPRAPRDHSLSSQPERAKPPEHTPNTHPEPAPPEQLQLPASSAPKPPKTLTLSTPPEPAPQPRWRSPNPPRGIPLPYWQPRSRNCQLGWHSKLWCPKSPCPHSDEAGTPKHSTSHISPQSHPDQTAPGSSGRGRNPQGEGVAAGEETGIRAPQNTAVPCQGSLLPPLPASPNPKTSYKVL